MMVVNAIDEGAYDTFATQTTYLKMVPFLVKDFLHRFDAKMMMQASNIPVSAQVTSAVTVAGPAGPFLGTGLGSFSTVAQPVYNGSTPTPETEAFKQQCAAAKISGDSSLSGLTSGLETAMGG